MYDILTYFIEFIEKFFSFTIIGRITIFDTFLFLVLVKGFIGLIKILMKGGNNE